MKTKRLELTSNHVMAALESYLKAMTMIHDNDEVIAVKEGNQLFYVTVEVKA